MEESGIMVADTGELTEHNVYIGANFIPLGCCTPLSRPCM